MKKQEKPNHNEAPGDILQGVRGQFNKLCEWFWTPHPPECKAHPIEESFKTTGELTNWLHKYYGISEDELIILSDDQDDRPTEIYFEDILIAKESQMPLSGKRVFDFTVDGAEYLNSLGNK